MSKNKTKTIYQIKTLFIVLIVFCSFAVLNTSFAQNFIGPSCAAGQCQGKIGVDSSGNVSMGTSTPQSGTKTLIISQTSDSSSYGLRVLSSNNSPLFLVRSDGKISIATSGASYALTVSGDIYASGNLVVGGTFSAPIPAGNVTPGVFNSLQGGGTGAYAFLGSLGIATSSQVGLPQALSVYGGGYFSGNVGIGTTAPGYKLDIQGGTGAVLNLSGSIKLRSGGEIDSYWSSFPSATWINLPTSGPSGIGTGGPGANPFFAYVYTDTNWFTNARAGDVAYRNMGGRLLFGNTSGNAGMSLYNNNLGINVRDPINKLDVSGGVAIGSYAGVNTAPSNGLLVDGNVGIGTTSPAYKLDVAGIINATDFYKNGAPFSGGSSQWTNTTGGIYYLGNVGIGTSAVSYPLFVSTSTDTLFAIQRTGASSPTIFKQGTDTGFVINNGGSDILTIKSGNVGIGTTGPNATLQVGNDYGNMSGKGAQFGISSIDPIIYINTTANSGSHYGSIVFGGGGIDKAKIDVGLYGVGGMRFFADNNVTTPVMVISAGNVGIGTTAPGSKFVVQTSDVGSYVRVSELYAPNNTTAGNASQIIFGSSGSTGNAAEWRYVHQSSNNPLNRLDFAFFGYATPVMSYTVGGNVGIGTTTPAYKLDVAGDIRATGSLFGNFAGTVPASNVTAGVFGAGNFAFQSSLGIATSSQVGLPQALSVYGGGYFSGNVGIGTTGPSEKLHVAGNIQIGSLGSSGGIAIKQGTYPFDSYFAYTDDGTAYGPAWIHTNVGTGGTTHPTMFLQSQGNSAKLNINSDLGLGPMTVTLGNYPSITTNVFIGGDSGDNSYFNTGGNVGIGTTSPSTILDVLASSAAVGIRSLSSTALGSSSGGGFLAATPNIPTAADQRLGTLIFGGITSGSTYQYSARIAAFSSQAWSSTAAGAYLTFMTVPNNSVSTVERMRIDQNGNVGIGTTGPTYKLDVASGGSVTARFGTASSDTVVIGGGAGKLTVGTVDPVYSISGKNYATYGPESIGVKVSHTGVLKLVLNKNKYEGVLDFKNAKEGDDLWLFAKTTNLASNFDKLTIQLTPAFKGKVWYNKDKENMIVKIYGEADELNNNELEVSYSLSAPRFDSEKWTNYSNDETVEGIKINY